ncbi:MAG: ribosome silencing factor [Bacteroidota bacterium]
MRSISLAKKIASLALTKKAGDILVMDLRKLNSVTDFFVVCSADSDVQIKAVVGAVQEGLLEEDVRAWHRESGSPNWALLDYVDVVLHVFHKNTRGFYNLEKLWGDAKIMRVEEKKVRAKPSRARRTPAKPRKRKLAS